MKNIKHITIILLTLLGSCKNNSIRKTEEFVKNNNTKKKYFNQK